MPDHDGVQSSCRAHRVEGVLHRNQLRCEPPAQACFSATSLYKSCTMLLGKLFRPVEAQNARTARAQDIETAGSKVNNVQQPTIGRNRPRLSRLVVLLIIFTLVSSVDPQERQTEPRPHMSTTASTAEQTATPHSSRRHATRATHIGTLTSDNLTSLPSPQHRQAGPRHYSPTTTADAAEQQRLVKYYSQQTLAAEPSINNPVKNAGTAPPANRGGLPETNRPRRMAHQMGAPLQQLARELHGSTMVGVIPQMLLSTMITDNGGHTQTATSGGWPTAVVWTSVVQRASFKAYNLPDRNTLPHSNIYHREATFGQPSLLLSRQDRPLPRRSQLQDNVRSGCYTDTFTLHWQLGLMSTVMAALATALAYAERPCRTRKTHVRARTPAAQRLMNRVRIMLTTKTAFSEGHHFTKLAAQRKHGYYKVRQRMLTFPANHWVVRCDLCTQCTQDPPHVRTRLVTTRGKHLLQKAKTPQQRHSGTVPTGTNSLTGAGPKGPPPRQQPRQATHAYVTPASVGLYAEKQQSHQCGAHALNSMLGRPAATGPGFIETYLRTTGCPERGFADIADNPCYKTGGDYQPLALNHWLYEHTTDNVALYMMDRVPQYPSPEHRMSLEKLQEMCPGCTEILVLDELAYGGHYYTWKQSPLTGDWYNLDSMQMSTHSNRVPKITARDWQNMRAVSIYILVQSDAYANGLTMQNPHRQQIDMSDNSISNINWHKRYPLVKGRDVQIYGSQTRSARRRFLETANELRRPAHSELIPTVEPTPHLSPQAVQATPDQSHTVLRGRKRAAEPQQPKAANPLASPTRQPPQSPPKTLIERQLQGRPSKAAKPTVTMTQDQPKKNKQATTTKPKKGKRQIPGQSSIIGFLTSLSNPWKNTNTSQCPADEDQQAQSLNKNTNNGNTPLDAEDDTPVQPAPKRQQLETQEKTQPGTKLPQEKTEPVTQGYNRTPDPQPTPPPESTLPQHDQEIQDVLTNVTTDFRVDNIQCRGSFTSHIAVQQHILDCKATAGEPQIIFLSETKLTKRRTTSHWLRETLRGYRSYHSTHPVSGSEPPKAGISIAVQDILADMSDQITDHTPEDLQGFLAHIEISLPESLPLHIIGVYYPCHGADKTIIRQRINSHILNTAREACSGQQTHRRKAYNMIVGGDFNAAAFQQDRTHHAKLDAIRSKKASNPDKLHSKFIGQTSTMGLIPTETHARKMTFYRQGPLGEKKMVSRIDDILTTIPQKGTTTEIINTEDWPTDHEIISWKCPWNLLSLIPPPPEITTQDMKGKRKLKTPMLQTEYQTLCLALEEALAVQFHDLQHKIATLLEATTEARSMQAYADAVATDTVTPSIISSLTGQPCQQVIDELGEEISQLCQQGKDIAFKTCTTVPVQTDSRHCRNRVVNRRYKRVNKTKHQANTWGQLQDHNIAAELLTKKTHRTLRQIVTQHMLEHPDKTRQEVANTISKQCQKELNNIIKEHPTFTAQERKRQFQKLADEKQKLGNKIATGQHKRKNNTELKYLIEEDTGELVTDPARIKPLIHKYISKRTMAENRHQGTPLTHKPQAPDPFPFASSTAIDQFELENPTPSTRTLAQIIDDEHTFQQTIKSLANNKSPGPDGVANEILKALPTAGKHAIHSLLKLMWATGCTPTSWKHSTTILLYKHKGKPTHLKGYRRIGLEVTLYKVWTKMVRAAMTHYGETNGIHSHSQAGFRNKRSTCEQFENLTLALEDAMGNQDMYLLQIDFSEAFDTVDHHKLIQVLLALGYPHDAIRVVQNLYTNATTAVQTPYGLTDKILIERGTIQGDGLSPLLFIIYLEPLLRWLQVGARGYHYTAIQQHADKVRHQTSDCTFADDLNILTNSHSDLAIQADKVTAYSQWARLKVNMDKTTATAALHKSNPHNPYGMNLISRRISSTVRIQGTPVKTQDPREPFKYLGIFFTMDLNWTHQYRHLLELTRKKISHLKNSWLSRNQKLRVLKTSIRPMITYSFPVAPYSEDQIKSLDSLLTAGWKQAYGLPISTPTAFIHEDTDKGGLGCPSLQVDYHAILAERLIRTLNDTTTTGCITRAIFEKQLKEANSTHNAAHRVDLQQRYLKLRQLQALQQIDLTSGLQLLKDDLDYSIDNKSGISNALITTMLTPQLALDICANHPAILADMLTLSRNGINTIHHLVHGSTGMCLPASALSKLDPHGTSPKCRKAINRITVLLHTLRSSNVDTSQYVDAIKQITPDDLPPAMRQVSHYAKTQILPRTPAAYPIKTSLCRQTAHERTQPTTDLDLRRKTPRHERDMSLKKANIRIAETLDPTDDSTTLKRRSTPHMTGWDLYQLIPAPAILARHGTSDRHTKERWGLYNAYAAADGTDILDITAIQSASDKHNHTKQQQLLVTWASAIMPYWTIQLAQHLGYHPASIKTATHEDIMENGVDTGCEYCVLNRECKEEGSLPTCDACCRSYHRGCLKPLDLQRWSNSNETEPWYCELCHNIATQLQDELNKTPSTSEVAAAISSELKWYKVEWQAHPEPRDFIESILQKEPEKYGHLDAKLRQLEEAQQAPPANRCKQPDDRYQGLQLTNLEKQGIYCEHIKEQQRYDKSLGEETAKLVKIHPQPMNPHTDIHAPGCTDISIQHVTYMMHGKLTVNEIACVHTPDDGTPYTLPPDRLHLLYARFCRTRSQNPKLHEKLQAGPFPAELHKLLARYKEGSRSRSATSHKAQESDQWALPPALQEVISAHTNSNKERFASPLNYAASTGAYWTPFERDQLFDAKWDTFKTQWSGSSIATPTFEPTAVCKAVKHAIESAKAAGGTPVLTTMVIPASTETNNPGYFNLIRSNAAYCNAILRVQASKFRFMSPPAYMQADKPTHRPRCDILILEVSNEAGRQQYIPNRTLQAVKDYRHSMMQAINQYLPQEDRLTSTAITRGARLAAAQLPSSPIPQQAQQPSARFRNLAKEAVDNNGNSLPHQVAPAPYWHQSLKYNWRQFAYTDGSFIDKATAQMQGLPDHAPRIGAAVYVPAQDDMDPDITKGYAPTEEDYRHDDTINRAELIALYQAIKMGCTHLASDSLASIYQIYTAAHRHQEINLNFHRHGALLDKVLTAIRELGTTLHVYKVPAHRGIVGNEMADERASAVAKGAVPPDDTIADPSNNRRSLWWPHHPPPLNQADDGDSQNCIVGPRPLPSLQALKAAAHASHALGSSNVQSIYFAARKTMKVAIDKVSSAFLTSTRVTCRETTNALKVVTGTLYTQARAFKMKKATSPVCLLCGQTDGTMHAVSGCPKLATAVIKRHNRAVTMITKAILMGANGSDVVSMDISKETQDEEGLTQTRSRNPERILPRRMPPSLRASIVRSHRPDITLFRRSTGRQGDRNTYTFVEVKYCRDTEPHDQIMRAREQHHELVQKIRQYDKHAKIELAVIPLGVAGAIYKSSRELLRHTLGVGGPSQDTLLRNLHIHAVHALTKILRQRGIALGTRLGKRSAAHTSAAAAVAKPAANARQAHTRTTARAYAFRRYSAKRKRKKKR